MTYWDRIRSSPSCRGEIHGSRALDVDQLIELLEPYRGQNRRVILRGDHYRDTAFRKLTVDRDGDIILKGQ